MGVWIRVCIFMVSLAQSHIQINDENKPIIKTNQNKLELTHLFFGPRLRPSQHILIQSGLRTQQCFVLASLQCL